MNRAPGGLMAICIVAILFGLLGFLSVAIGIAGPFIGEAIKGSIQPPNRGNGPIAQRQLQFEEDIKAATDKWAPVIYTLLAVHVVVAVCLIFGGIQAMRLQPNGRQMLTVAFLLAIVFSFVKLIPDVSIQLATKEITEKFVAETLQGPPGGAPPPRGAQRIAEASMKAGLFIGFATMGVWLMLKIGYYGFGTYYLRQPAIAALFDGPNERFDIDDFPDDE